RSFRSARSILRLGGAFSVGLAVSVGLGGLAESTLGGSGLSGLVSTCLGAGLGGGVGSTWRIGFSFGAGVGGFGGTGAVGLPFWMSSVRAILGLPPPPASAASMKREGTNWSLG